ncbi:tetratricopeptide repeat-containing protein [Liquorilactobacillus mali]
MFGFNKKKKVEFTNAKELTSEEIENLIIRAAKLKKEVSAANADDEKIKLYEDLGTVYVKLNQTDNAISAYEASLKIKEQFGDAYNVLLNLYEEKRKIAAAAKDDAEIQKWIGKTDRLLDMSKRVLRSNMF